MDRCTPFAAMNSKILFVDDDPNLLAAFQRSFRKVFSFDTAEGGTQALKLLTSSGPYAVVVVDMNMPGMNGVEVLEHIHLRSPDTVRIMLTGNADQHTAAEAVNRGQVFRFLTKPCMPEELMGAVAQALKHYEREQIERELLESTLTGCVKTLAEVLGMVAPEALGQGRRLRDSIKPLAVLSGCSAPWEVEIAALFSPIGFTAVPLSVVRKLSDGTALSPTERRIVDEVPRIGSSLLASIPRLANVAKIVAYQNKNYDGTGFPADTVAGERIPIGSRLLRILSDRLVLEAEGVIRQQALQVMKLRVGIYDPKLLDLCFTCFETFLSSQLRGDIPVRALPIRELRAGQIVASDIATRSGLLLIGRDHCVTPMMLERLLNYAQLGEVQEPVLIQNPPPASSPFPSTSRAPFKVVPATGVGACV